MRTTSPSRTEFSPAPGRPLSGGRGLTPGAPCLGGLGLGVPAVLVAALLVSGCAGFHPEPSTVESIKARSVARSRSDLEVSVAALGAKESRRMFGVDVNGKGVQSIWIEVANHSQELYSYLPAATDPNYYPALEVAYMHHRWAAPNANRTVNEYFLTNAMPLTVRPNSTASGFVFKGKTTGAEAVQVELLGHRDLVSFVFTLEIPGFTADWQETDFDRLIPPDQRRSVRRGELRRALEELPSCTTDAKGEKTGDPLNLILVGSFQTVLRCLVKGGWQLTEPLDIGSSVKTFESFILGRPYPTAPVSALYVFGRQQDMALQKARVSLKRRNHLRLWMTPLIYERQPVWIGQISRDVGVHFTTKTWHLTTHTIAPDVDETRDYLLANLLVSQGVKEGGWVKGVGFSSPAARRGNLTDDPFYTDGLRLVLVLGEEPIPVHQLERLGWESPPPDPRSTTLLE